MRKLILFVGLVASASYCHAAQGYGTVTISSNVATAIISTSTARTWSPFASSRELVYINNGSTTAFCGPSSSVSVSSGIPINPGVGFQSKTDINTPTDYCISAPTFTVDMRFRWWTE